MSICFKNVRDEMISNDVTILFCSCDAYSDLWDNFFMLLKKYWPEYDGEIIINTESKGFCYEGLRISSPLNCSSEVSWSDRLSLSLKRVKTPYVLIFLDDFYLKSPVRHKDFMKTLNYMKSHKDVASITYLKEPGGRESIPDLDGFVQRAKCALYKMTAHITLYKTEYLQSVLKHNESAWEFEVNGTIRSWLKTGMFLCPTNNEKAIFPYDFKGWSLCVKGKFYGPVKRYFEEQEGLKFYDERETIEVLPQGSGGSLTKKLHYLGKGLLSIFKKRAL